MSQPGDGQGLDGGGGGCDGMEGGSTGMWSPPLLLIIRPVPDCLRHTWREWESQNRVNSKRQSPLLD